MNTQSFKTSEAGNSWIVVDAKNKTLGRLATKIAFRLVGKHKPEFTPNADLGDYVIVINAEKINVTGQKLFQKKYYSHSGYPGGIKERKLKDLLEVSPTANIKGLKGATGFIKPEEWEAKKKSLKKSIEKTTGYLLLERIDYNHIAKTIIKQYGLKSKIKMGTGINFGEYIPETDTITLRPSYKNVKDFLMTILHEIGHALDAQRLGVRKYIKKYTQAGTMATYHGLDPHDDNKWEDRAEKFARREIKKWM